MISPTLLQKLVERNIVKATTEVEALYRSFGIDGLETVASVATFVITAIEPRGEGFVFEVVDVAHGRRRKIHSAHVRRIDGMDGRRIGATYGLSETGEQLNLGRRRGRKPKNQSALPTSV